MARGGYFAGNDYVDYQPGQLEHSSAISRKEIRKQKTIKCPKCSRVVPLREFCIFCDYIFTEKDLI